MRHHTVLLAPFAVKSLKKCACILTWPVRHHKRRKSTQLDRRPTVKRRGPSIGESFSHSHPHPALRPLEARAVARQPDVTSGTIRDGPGLEHGDGHNLRNPFAQLMKPSPEN